MLVRQKGKHHYIQAEQSEQAVEGNPLKGGRVHIHTSSFKIGVEEALKALDGPPAWSARLRRIEEWVEYTVAEARQAWARMALDYYGENGGFREAWERYAENVDFKKINALIDRHNKYFPIEANLPCNIKTGKLMWGGKPFKKMNYFTSQWLLEIFPPNLDMALECARSMGIDSADMDSMTEWG